MLQPRLGLGQADRAELRRREDGRRNIGVIDGARLAAENRIGESVTFADRDRRQAPDGS